MELSAKYAYEVYEKRSFSLAAKAMYVSQPALSAMISKLERELGFKIFDRSTLPLSITPKGQIYIDMLTEMQESERQMKKRLETFTAKPIKHLGIGTSLFIADSVLPETCRRFWDIYPDIHIKLNKGEKGAKTVLHDQLASHDIDLLIAFRYDSSTECAFPLVRRRWLIAARRDLPGIEALMPYALTRLDVLSGNYKKEIGNTELPLFGDVKFITTDTSTGYMRLITNLLGNNYSLSNISVKNIRHLGTNYKMMRAGLGATVCTDADVAHPLFSDERIVYFAFKGQGHAQPIYAVHRQGEELSAEAERFAGIFKEVLEELSKRAMG